MKQPHEDILGSDRNDDPYVSEGNRAAIGRLVQNLYSLSLTGSPAPSVQRLRESMLHPVVGDKVAVLEATYRHDSIQITRGIGILIEVRQEWLSTDEQWALEIAADASLADEGRPIEGRAWYVQYGPSPSDVCRWTDCTVLSIEATA